MALSNTTVKIILAGNGSNVDFAIPFDIIVAESEVKVYVRDTSASPATETLQTLTTHYTLTGAVGSGFNNNVRFVTAPSATDEVLLIRVLPKTQTLDLGPATDQKPESTEKELDRLAAQGQENDEAIDRALKFSKSYGSNPADIEPVASTYVGFDASKNLVTTAIPITVTDSGFDASKNLVTTAIPITVTDSVLASQVEAEAGTENTTYTSPLRVRQAIEEYRKYGLAVYRDASTSCTHNTATRIDFKSLLFDADSTVTTGVSWTYGNLEAGYFEVKAHVTLAASTAWAIGEYAKLYLYQGGIQIIELDKFVFPATSASSIEVSLTGSYIFEANAIGRDMNVRVLQNSGGAIALNDVITDNWIVFRKA